MPGALPLILAAEDEETDALILRRAFQMTGFPNPLRIVPDGQEAVNYLDGTAAYGDRLLHPLPGLLLLDLKMPRMNGLDVLGWIAARPEFKSLPVVVLSSSSADADLKSTRESGARDYFVKPTGLPEYVRLLQGLIARWLTPVPSRGSVTG